MTSISPTYNKHQSIGDPANFLSQLDFIRTDLQNKLDKDRQSEMGQFLTPPTVANMMAGMFTHFRPSINLLDPGAGVGSLSAAFIATAVVASQRPDNIKLIAFELDPILIKWLEITLNACQQLCEQFEINFSYEIHQEDFISTSFEKLSGENTLFPVDHLNYNYAILNPPYKKINSSSRTRHLLSSIGIETTNMYSAFMWLVMKLLEPKGEMVAIVPRSFCNGTYFRPFRSELLQTMVIERIHIFGSRDKAFNEGDVLQENIIVHAIKNQNPQQKITITSSDDPEDDHLVTREIEFDQLVEPDDPELFIRIVPDQLGHQISTQVNGLTSSLKELGITASTGRVVDFRARELLRDTPDKEIIPLIYPGNLQNSYVTWPRPSTKKASYLASSSEVNHLVIPSEYYVLVKRFSSKEEKRRVYAAVYDPKKISAKKVGIENHINYFHRRYGGLSADFAKGLTLYLNSSLVDQFFRQFSGHTQVNATDLRNLKYPSEAQLLALGRRISDQFPDQDGIDKIVTEELVLNEKNGETDIQDPILAKKKIKEALSILQLLHVPRAQQNDRSALTLLALANIRATTKWNDATDNMMGITEMMDYFRDNYGINYAPNTRETVRRQTVHQFLQLGLALANPDDPSRPINSPKTRYIIEPTTLELIRTFGTPDWEGNLVEYLRNATSLGRLQVRERVMTMMPVTLPDGGTILLSSGGQNELIKKIVEEFCPRFTPGGKIIYIGDAGEKLNEKELKYFEQLGIKIDKHGKMPDLVVEVPEKKWLILIEAVTSHGPINIKRHNELQELFGQGEYGLVFVTAFEGRKAMHKYLSEIAWETEVWVSEAPSHLIHFNGERFLGPYSSKE
jgi:adenine-specific DNA-methyltransferase